MAALPRKKKQLPGDGSALLCRPDSLSTHEARASLEIRRDLGWVLVQSWPQTATGLRAHGLVRVTRSVGKHDVVRGRARRVALLHEAGIPRRNPCRRRREGL